jgi:hypothetical protein
MITTQPVPGRSAGSLTWARIYNVLLDRSKKRIAAVFIDRCCHSPTSVCWASTGGSARGIYAAVNAGANRLTFAVQ